MDLICNKSGAFLQLAHWKLAKLQPYPLHVNAYLDDQANSDSGNID